METINHFQCFDYMIYSANDILDEDFIKNTHKILKTNTSDSRISWFNVGEYKSRKNMVGDLGYCDACFTGNYPMKVPGKDVSHAFE